MPDPVDPLAADDDERPDSGRGDPVMATDRFPARAAGTHWFEPPEPPPPSADRLTIEAYELEQVAYERALQRH